MGCLKRHKWARDERGKSRCPGGLAVAGKGREEPDSHGFHADCTTGSVSSLCLYEWLFYKQPCEWSLLNLLKIGTDIVGSEGEKPGRIPAGIENMKICVIGTGYVGLVTGVIFADLGNEVICVDKLEAKVEQLQRGEMPIYEPGLEELVQRNAEEGRLSFTSDLAGAVRGSEIIYICVGTPPRPDGSTDMGQIEGAARGIAAAMNGYKVIVNKSTVPVGTGSFVREIIETSGRDDLQFDVVSNPEFLREGSAIQDALNPDRIVIGAPNPVAAQKIQDLYAPLECPVLITDVASAELTKYASNAFLAVKISFANSIANICEAVGADIIQVMKGVGRDRRIGPDFLHAGLGYGGSCFTGEETVFVAGRHGIQSQRLDSLFHRASERWLDKSVEVARIPGLSVLAYQLEEGRGTLAPVEVLTRRHYTGPLVTIKASMGRTLRVTGDHPVILQREDGELQIKRAAQVVPGERLLTLLGMPAHLEENGPMELNLIDLLVGTDLEADVHVEPFDDAFTRLYPEFAAAIPTERYRCPHDIKRFNRMPLWLYHHLRAQGVLPVAADNVRLYTAKGAGTRINAIIPLDKDVLRLLGYYLSEGCIACDTGRAGALRERTLFSFHEDERDYISEVRQTLERLGMKWIERHATHCKTTIVSSRIFAFLLRDVLGCGTRSEDKTLPSIAFSVGAGARRALLEGLYRGDGGVEWQQGGKNLNFTCATVSKALAEGTVLLLQSLGIVPSVKAQWMNKSTRIAYHLDVSGIKQLQALDGLLGAKHQERIAATLAGYQRIIKQRGFDKQGSCAILTVREVLTELFEQAVYSLETATGTVIVGAGLVAHNCFPKDSSSLLHTAQSVGYDFPILAATIQTNDEQPKRFIKKIETALGGFSGKKIALLGLAFKANTDDMRDAKSLDVIAAVLAGGGEIVAFDPIAMENCKKIFPQITYAKSAFEAAEGADATVVVTEWNEFKQINLEKLKAAMKGSFVFDGRNLYDPEQMRRAGFIYQGIGRGTVK